MLPFCLNEHHKLIKLNTNDLHITSYSRITNDKVILNGSEIAIIQNDSAKSSWLNDIYRTIKPEYPKFFKMDRLSKLGFIASELVISKTVNREEPKQQSGVILFNRSSSLDADKAYQKTISDSEKFFPSPSMFVYTLANIVTGEIAIRNKYYGETSFYIEKQFNAHTLFQTVFDTFNQSDLEQIICGWVDLEEEHYDSLMFNIEYKNGIPFSIEEINKIYQILN